MERKLIITSALKSRRKAGPWKLGKVLVAAKGINLGGLADQARAAKERGDWLLACALALDDALIRLKELKRGREEYQKARKRAMDEGDTGLVVELEVRWDARLGSLGDEKKIIAETAEQIGGILFGMYRREGVSLRQWEGLVRRMREMLTEELAETLSESVEFIRLTPDELENIGLAWVNGEVAALERIRTEEKFSAGPGGLLSL